MQESQRLVKFVDDTMVTRGTYDPVDFREIMKHAVNMRTMVTSRMFNQHNQWFMEFIFIDGSAITYGMDDEF